MGEKSRPFRIKRLQLNINRRIVAQRLATQTELLDQTHIAL